MSNVLPQGWEEKELFFIANYINSKIEVKNLTLNNYISTENMNPNIGGIQIASSIPNVIKVNEFHKEDILFSNIRTYFKKIWFATFDGGSSSDVLTIRKKNNFSSKYLYYTLTTENFFDYTVKTSKGTKMPRGDKNAILQYKIKFPSDINEQKRIADILSAFDDKIELNNQMNQTLEDMATTLFKEWFIDNESNNWEVRTLGSLGKVITGKTPSTKNKDYWGDGIFFITPTDFKNYKKYAFNSERSLSILGKESSKRIVLPKETILVTCIGSDMGKVVIAQNECISNQQINALIIDNDYLQEYVYQYLKHIYPHLRQIAMGGSTMPIINKSAFENIEIILPPIDLLKKFQDIAFSFNQIIIKNTKENQTLKEQRDTLLPKLMSGEIRV